MSRYFAIQSWVSSHDNEPDYSGQQTGSRHVRSVEIPMFTQHGKANVDWFSDEQIALRSAANKPKPSIKDKILPQAKRLSVLREQMLELETSYRAGEMDISDYTLYRDIIVAKIQRQEVLYKRAASVRPIRPESEEDEAFSYAENFSNASDNDGHGESYSSTKGVGFFAEVVDELSDSNSLKNILKKTCVVCRTLVRWHNTTKAYVQTLKEV